MIKTIILTAAVALSLAACKKKDKDDTPFSGTITITAPAESATINGGSSFAVTGTITGNREMHGYHIIVYDQNDQSVVYENQYHDHAESYTISETVSHTLTASTPLRLVVEVAGDHEDESVTKEVLFGYAP